MVTINKLATLVLGKCMRETWIRKVAYCCIFPFYKYIRILTFCEFVFLDQAEKVAEVAVRTLTANVTQDSR